MISAMLQVRAVTSDSESVAGALRKWTTFGKGWRSRWFLLDTRDGSLFYSKSPSFVFQHRGVRLIGAVPDEDQREHSQQQAGGVVHMKISSFRESKTDERRFYLFTAAKTLHLKTNSKGDRLDWLTALRSIKSHSPSNFLSSKLAISTGRLKRFLLNQGAHEDTVNQCEQIILSEFDLHRHSTFLRYLEETEATISDDESFHDTEEYFEEDKKMQLERRRTLPDPIEKEQTVSLWSLIKDNVGKDLTKVCLPVYFNEPISLLQKCFEDLEYSELLDKAYESDTPLLRILNVAAFAVSGYASTKTRACKPFNPLLGETYEANYPEKGLRFLAEKVSHHPTIMACHCEGRGWKLYGDTTLQSKFWGQSIQVNPAGTLTLEFADGETFRWSKVTSTIHNVVIGRLYCDHHGVMEIRGNRQYSAKMKFKNHSFIERNRRQVHGYVEYASGGRLATLFGKWDEGLYYVEDDVAEKLLWRSTCPPANLTRYNLTEFAITLNELTPGLKEKLPPTDSRLRPDQRYLENGEYANANGEKQRLEKRQRLSRKLQEFGWKPRWFEKGERDGYRFVGGYWEARDFGLWVGCADIFGDFNELSNLENSS